MIEPAECVCLYYIYMHVYIYSGIVPSEAVIGILKVDNVETVLVAGMLLFVKHDVSWKTRKH